MLTLNSSEVTLAVCVNRLRGQQFMDMHTQSSMTHNLRNIPTGIWLSHLINQASGLCLDALRGISLCKAQDIRCMLDAD